MSFFRKDKNKKQEKVKKKKISKKEIKKIEKRKKQERLEKKIRRKEKLSKIDTTPILGGVAVGIANIIPGVSGGTMLVIFNLFDKLTNAVSNVFSKDKKVKKESLLLIIKIFLGTFIGILVFAKILGFTLKHFEAETIFWFVGLIIFSVPLIIKKELKDEKFSFIFFIIGILIIGVLQYLNVNKITLDNSGTNNLWHLISLGLYGIIGGVTMIFPGVSGSMVLLILGKYEMIRGYISDITKFDFNIYLYLGIFGIGALLGIVLSSKVLSFVLKKYKGKTISLILGFILASAFILPFNIKNEINFTTGKVCAIIGCFTLGAIMNYYISYFQNKK